MTNKLRFGVIFLVLATLLLSGVVSADIPSGVQITKIEIEGVEYEPADIPNNVRLDIIRGDEIELRVEFENSNTTEELKGVQVEAFIRGYDHDDLIEDITDVFDMRPNTKYVKKLNLKIPQRIEIDEDDEYTMAILIESREGVHATLTWNLHLRISSERHELAIKDTVLNPENEVRAGRALLTTVRIKNYGQKDEEGIKVKVGIPQLGISASDYIDELEADESTTSEEIYLRIPECAAPGTYKVQVEVEYDDGDEVVKSSAVIDVTESDTCAPAAPGGERPKTIISVGADTQDVVAGAGGVVYPLTITNAGQASKAYTVTVDGADWADTRVSPSNTVVLGADETASMFVYVSAKQGTASGLRMLSLTVSSGGEILKQVPLKANVVAGAGASATGIKQGLEIALVVLVVLLVILGLIIGFSKMRGGEEEEGPKTYY